MPEVHENILKIGDSEKIPLSQIGDTGRIAVPAGRAECFSEVGTGLSSRDFAVDWSLISRVDMSSLEAVYVSGQLMPASQNPGARREANFHLYLPDATVARSVANAFEILRSSCKRRSRFD